MTQKKSSKEPEVEEVKEPDIEVQVEGEAVPDNPDIKEKPEDKSDEDVEALRQQIEQLKSAQDNSRNQALEAERRAHQIASQLQSYRQNAEQSQYDSIVSAMGAAQIEIDSAKRDIVLAGSAQDFGALADAQERLSAAKAHMIGLEQGKSQYEAAAQQQQHQDPIDSTPGLSYEEKAWLRQHPDAMSNPRKNAKLNAAYYDAMDKGLTRGSQEYFTFIEEQMGYRQPETRQESRRQEEDESSVMVAAPPSKSVPSGTGTGQKKGVYTLTREEAEIAKLSGITPQEYVKQREALREQKRVHPGDYPER